MPAFAIVPPTAEPSGEPRAGLPDSRPAGAGVLLRAWRVKRRLSQLALALDAGVSARHLSFVENGRAQASADLLGALAEQLAVPLRERNALFLAAGYAPRFAETPLDAPDMASILAGLKRLLDAHDPYPGIALDRHWNVVLTNRAAGALVALLPPKLTTPALNIFRASLHPEGFAAITENFGEWGRHVLAELTQFAETSLDANATVLLDEVRAYPNVRTLLAESRATASPPRQLLIPCTLRLPHARLSMFTTLATFGSPRDLTLAELKVELFYPADAASAAALGMRADAMPG
jgi:transcriptional regulator with XRE-family HTH domain